MTTDPFPGTDLPANEQAAADDESALRSHLRDLLSEGAALVTARQAALAPFLDADGYTVEDEQSRHDDALITAALQASDWLGSATRRLADLLGPPPRPTFTITIDHKGNEEGAAAVTFVVYAADLVEAQNAARQFQLYQDWTEGKPFDDFDFVAEQCHPGLPRPPSYIDLRAQQLAADAARMRPSPLNRHPIPPPSAPGGPPHRH